MLPHATLGGGGGAGLSTVYQPLAPNEYEICHQSVESYYCLDWTVVQAEYEALNNSLGNKVLSPFGCIMKCKAMDSEVSRYFPMYAEKNYSF